MWPFLFLLAIVPAIYYWSDSVREMFPALEEFLPSKDAALTPSDSPANQLPATLQEGQLPGQWYVIEHDGQYLAWMMSDDGQYRVAVGCHKESPAALQVTHLGGATPPQELHLNYQYGALLLNKGGYYGPELVGSVAQFSDVYLQNSAKEVLARFQAPAASSNLVARAIESTCAQ